MAKTTLQLGDFVFAAYEIPESINFGGAQKLVAHKLPGGKRVVQSMGRDDAPLAWSGLFTGQNATARAKYLDYLRAAGKPLTLTWSSFKYSVVIEDFNAKYEREWQIPYSISCMVVADLASPVKQPVESGYEKAIWGDNDTAQALGAQIGDGPLSSLLSMMDSAIKGVSSFANLATSTMNSILGPVAAVMGRVQQLQASVGNTLISVGSLGGMVPNSSVAQMASRMASQMNVTSQSSLLSQLSSVTGRITTNLNLVSGGAGAAQTASAVGGTFYEKAASLYGDATKGPALAKVNGSADMNISGIQTIKTPTNLPDTTVA